MLHTLLSTVNKDSADLLQRVIRETGQLVLDRVFVPHPAPHELSRALNTLRLDVILLDITYSGTAASLVEQIRRMDATLPVIGFSTQTSPTARPRDLAAFLEPPFSVRNVVQTAREAIGRRGPSNHPNVTAIVPAKAGGGATTIATNIAAQLARSFGKKVLVAECDLQSGTIGERIGSRPSRSIAETLESADVASTLIWPQHVSCKEGVDFLITNRGTSMRQPAWHEYHHLLNFAAGRYDHVVLDLPDVVNEAASEALHASSAVYIMTTPELLSLSLVSQRLADLEAAKVDRSKVRILVNRWQPGDIGPPEIAAMLGCPVAAIFPNDYRAVNAAILRQSFVDSATRLGRAYRSFAATLADEPDQVQASAGFRFLLKPFRLARPAMLDNRV